MVSFRVIKTIHNVDNALVHVCGYILGRPMRRPGPRVDTRPICQIRQTSIRPLRDIF